MIYVQFYQMSTGYIAGTIPPEFGEPKPVEAVGSLGVLRLDARFSSARQHNLAAQLTKARKYVGYVLYKGESFTRSKPISNYRSVA